MSLQLTRRPLNLHLAPFETFPPSRHVSAFTSQGSRDLLKSSSISVVQVDTPPSGPPLVIESMTHLARLTYEEYNIRVAALQQVQVNRVWPPGVVRHGCGCG